jgi:hypothetical protein
VNRSTPNGARTVETITTRPPGAAPR